MSAYVKELRDVIGNLKNGQTEKIEQLDRALTAVVEHGSVEDLNDSLREVEEFLNGEKLNFDVIGKSKTA